jgi:NTE family protein
MMKIFLLILFPLSAFCQNTYDYKNLALEGGGMKGIAYAGVCKVLEEKGVMQKIENVAGTSAGAIAGFMICIGYNATEIDSIMMAIPFERFNDGKGGLLGKYRRIKRRFGVYKGDRFEDWLKVMLLAKTGNAALTFGELHALKTKNPLYKDLYCTGTNISKQRLEIFSYKTTPNFSIATAVRISGGIPLYFTPIALDDSLHIISELDTTKYINYYVDGGMLCNYPISMFDSCKAGGEALLCNNLVFNKQTLGIKLERQEQIDNYLKNSNEIPRFDPKSFGDYMGAFGNLMMETMQRQYPNLDNEKGRTIFVSDGKVSAKIKKISFEKKRLLFDNGVKGALMFFETIP